MIRTHWLLAVCALVACMGLTQSADAQPNCPEEPPLQNYAGGGQFVCPCFISGEQAGAVLDAPAEHYPIEILRIGIGWGSQFGGTGQTLEQSIHVYGAGLPNPGAPIFSLDGPALIDGVINEFDIEPLLGEVIVNSGPFTVTLEFLNDNAGDQFAPSMVYDNGCQSGKNVVYAIPGGWFNACLLGVNGDWIVYVIYRQVNCLVGVGDEEIVTNAPALFDLHQNFPNPFNPATTIRFDLPTSQRTSLHVFALDGSLVRALVDDVVGAGRHDILWNGRDDRGRPVPAGVYYYRLETKLFQETRRMVMIK